MVAKNNYTPKIVVLKKILTEDSASEKVEQKKTSVFRSMLRKPPKSEVHVHSLTLFYEATLKVSGRYVADFYRKATHTISVNANVKDVVLGDGRFLIESKSGVMKKLGASKAKNKIDLKLEEHVFIDEEETMVFDQHGTQIKFPFKINSKTIENYPTKILERNEKNVKKLEISYEKIIEKLESKLKKAVAPHVRDLNEELTINEMTEVYVPIYEARLVGPKKKVEILRIDAIRKKIL